MMALVAGDFDRAESSARQALEESEGYNDQALTFYGALMMWTWWQRDDFASPSGTFREVAAQAPVAYPTVRAALALFDAESGATDESLASLRALSDLGWINAADDRTEGVALALAAAACSVVGDGSRDYALHLYQEMRPYGGTVIVARAPAAACLGPADQYLGLLAAVMGDLAAHRGPPRGLATTRPPDGLRTVRRGGRGRAGPNLAPAAPGGRRGAGRRAPAQRGGVGVAPGIVAGGAHGRRAGVSRSVGGRCPPRSRARPVRLRAWRPHRGSRPAMLLNRASRKPGMSAMGANSRGPMMSTSMSDCAVTVAVRGPGSSAASSPKKSPGPNVFTRRPFWVTATVPARMRKNSRPMRPSRVRTSPSPTCIRSARRATCSNWASVQSRSWSTAFSRSTVVGPSWVVTTRHIPSDATQPRLRAKRYG